MKLSYWWLVGALLLVTAGCQQQVNNSTRPTPMAHGMGNPDRGTGNPDRGMGNPDRPRGNPDRESMRSPFMRSEARAHGGPVYSADASEIGTGPILLEDVTQSAGINFMHRHGGSGRHYYIESMAGGCAFLDYDGDGWQDIYLPQGAPLPNYRGPRPLRSALYHNNRNGTFTDAIAGSGLDIELYAMAPTVGDYDNDGDADLYVTALGGNRLFANQGHGKFRDVTRRAGVAGRDMSTGAAWLDYDRDGDIDLFVCRYCDYSIKTDPVCIDGGPTYCPPDRLNRAPAFLYRNNGDGTFADVTKKSGIGAFTGHGLGVVAADFNSDGWTDIFVANDQSGNHLFINNRNQTFREEAAASGARDPKKYAGMGTDAGDFLNEGRVSIVVTNFRKEPISLYHNQNNGIFVTRTDLPALSTGPSLYVQWGIRLVDFDLDGFQDLFVVSGDTDDSLPMLPRPNDNDKISYPQPCQVLRNDKGHFVDLGARAGKFFLRAQVGRGAAFGDYDNDGDADVLVACNNEPAILLRNDSTIANGWIRLALTGSARGKQKGCNRDALGAIARVKANGMQQMQVMRSATSYMSDHDRRLLFGIGNATEAQVEITWPCGAVQKLKAPKNKLTVIREVNCRLKR